MKQEQEDVQFLGRVIFTTLPDSPVSQLKPASATPYVTNGKTFKEGGSVVSITNFLGGADGQEIIIKGAGFTTIVHGTYIKTNTGANKLLAANRVYRFIYFNEDRLWVEQ